MRSREVKTPDSNTPPLANSSQAKFRTHTVFSGFSTHGDLSISETNFLEKKKKTVLSEKSSGDEEGENLTVVSYDTNQVCKIK